MDADEARPISHSASRALRGRSPARSVVLKAATALVLTAFAASCTVASPQDTLSPGGGASPPGNPASSPAGPGATFVAEADGYTLSVTVDRMVVAPGDTVTFTSSFHNGTAEPIDLAGRGCSAAGSIHLEVAMPREPFGRTWTGIAGEFKDYVLSQGMGPGIVPALDPLSIPARAMPCVDGDFDGTLEPGGTVTGSLTWRAEIVRGVTALPGDISFTAAAGYDQQNEAPSYPPGYTGIRGSWTPMFKQLTVAGHLTMTGGAPAIKGPGEAIDALLGDPAFATWLAEQPSSTWTNANLFLVSMPKAEGIMPAGPSWKINLFREIGVPRHWAIGFVDPFEGSLRSVTYCDIPCDR